MPQRLLGHELGIITFAAPIELLDLIRIADDLTGSIASQASDSPLRACLILRQERSPAR